MAEQLEAGQLLADDYCLRVDMTDNIQADDDFVDFAFEGGAVVLLEVFQFEGPVQF